jgi:GT2 family glycosyltransferase
VTTSVIVLSRAPGDWLEAALRSVAEQADEVVLVDNGSTDAQASEIGRRLGARVLRSETNLGYAGGVNLGARHASGEVLALLNDDAVAGPGWLGDAVDALGDRAVAAVTPKVRLTGWYRELRLADTAWSAPGDGRVLGRRLSSVAVDGRDILGRLSGPGVHRLETDPGADPARWRWTVPGQAIYVPVADLSSAVVVDGEVMTGPPCRLLNKAGSMLRADGSLGDVGEGEADDGRWDDPGERFFASGTAVVFTAETFARIGGLAEPFFAYYEDADWSWRARLAGLRIVYLPSTVVDHRQSATSGGASSGWVRRLGARNHMLCLARNAPLPVAAGAIRRRLVEPDPDGVRRALLARLPWAVASRGALSRRWVVSPAELWSAWAGSADGAAPA